MEIATIDGIAYQIKSIKGDMMKILNPDFIGHIQDIVNKKRTVHLIRWGRLNELIKIINIVEIYHTEQERVVIIQIKKL